VKLPPGFKAIGTQWVHSVKSDGRLKARLVAQGFSQREGLDYNEIFSPVVRFETVRIILALAAVDNWYISGLDVRSAYLYGEISEEIYVKQPEGFKVKGKEDLVHRLLRALYGLKQAGLAWWRTLVKSMVEELGFTAIVSDAGIYVYTKDGAFVLAAVYVDDAIFCGPNKAMVLRLKTAFMKRYECRDLGELKEFLGMRINRSGQRIAIDQCAYLETLSTCVGMTNAKSVSTPLPTGYMPAPNKGAVDPELTRCFQVTCHIRAATPDPGHTPDLRTDFQHTSDELRTLPKPPRSNSEPQHESHRASELRTIPTACQPPWT
jgi:hypothetical protein